ncbi:MAG: hypothetical protein JNM90_01700 [Burkholderiales bacterium]|nr:hypothetical protein [Burkholderiales bacterium]
MNSLSCPICSDGALGAPFMFNGRWLAACVRCHSESELRKVTAGSGAMTFQLTATMKLATLREVEQYRRRTVF